MRRSHLSFLACLALSAWVLPAVADFVSTNSGNPPSEPTPVYSPVDLYYAGSSLAPEGASAYLGFRYKLLLKRGDCEFREVGPGFEFRSGDKFRVRFQANQTSYVYFYNEGTSGRGSLLFPDRRIMRGMNLLKAYSDVMIPPTDWFTFTGDPGTEKFYVFVSSKPIPALESAYLRRTGASLGAEEWQAVMTAFRNGANERDIVLADNGLAPAAVDASSGSDMTTNYVLTPAGGPGYLVRLIALSHK